MLLIDKRDTIYGLETTAAVDSRHSADILQHFIASREKHASNNTSIQHRSAPPIKVASLPFIAAGKWFLTYPSSLYVHQHPACDQFKLVYMLAVYSLTYTAHTSTRFLLILWICRWHWQRALTNICISQTCTFVKGAMTPVTNCDAGQRRVITE